MNKKLSLSTIILCLALSASAQTFQEGFFLEANRNAFRFNPASVSDTDFLSVGNISNTGAGNIGASSFQFKDPATGEMVSGFNAAVPAEKFLAGLNDNNKQLGELNYGLFSYGFARNGAFHTVEASVKNLYNVGVAKDLFALMKKGTGMSQFDIAGTGASENLYAELAYGYSRKLSDIVSVGARAKLLVGLASASYQMSSMDIAVTDEETHFKGETQLYFTNRSRKINTNDGQAIKLRDIQKKKKGVLPTGLGLALDLGVTVTPDDYWTISASVLDLGGILWHYGNVATSKGEFVYEELIDQLVDEDADFSQIKQSVEGAIDDIISVVKLKKGPAKFPVVAVPMKANLGVKCKMPFYENLSVGLTGNFTGYKGLPYLESRFGVGLAPWDWISATGNVGYGTFGAVWGAGANVRVNRFRLNFALENYFGGKVPLSNYALGARKKVMSAGLTFDLEKPCEHSYPFVRTSFPREAPGMTATAAQHKVNVGKGLLISAGAMTVVGAGCYALALINMGEGGPFQSIMAISGVSLMGASVGMYTAGTIVLCKGKKAQRAVNTTAPQYTLAMAPNGLALRF